MSTQENSFTTGTVPAGTGTNPPLVEVTSQLSPDSTAFTQTVASNPPVKPQVVFVEQKRQTQIIEIHVEPKAADATPDVEPVEPAIKESAAMSIAPAVAVEPVGIESLASEQRFAVDPFVYEIDGPIPVMPTIPIVEPNISTDQVVAREQSGEHFAWRLMPIPHQAEGSSSQSPADETVNVARPSMTRRPQENAEPWTETEVVAENENCDRGDCFYAQSGDVIAIDGNKGFDHIDLRSYSIDDATFQRGAILLHADLQTAEAGEGEESFQPITIRHRGIDFAVFKGEVRVEL